MYDQMCSRHRGLRVLLGLEKKQINSKLLFISQQIKNNISTSSNKNTYWHLENRYLLIIQKQEQYLNKLNNATIFYTKWITVQLTLKLMLINSTKNVSETLLTKNHYKNYCLIIKYWTMSPSSSSNFIARN